MLLFYLAGRRHRYRRPALRLVTTPPPVQEYRKRGSAIYPLLTLLRESDATTPLCLFACRGHSGSHGWHPRHPGPRGRQHGGMDDGICLLQGPCRQPLNHRSHPSGIRRHLANVVEGNDRSCLQPVPGVRSAAAVPSTDAAKGTTAMKKGAPQGPSLRSSGPRPADQSSVRNVVEKPASGRRIPAASATREAFTAWVMAPSRTTRR